jgi:hypothetical protein
LNEVGNRVFRGTPFRFGGWAVMAIACLPLTHAADAHGSSGRSLIDFLLDGGTSQVECVDVSVDHIGIFCVDGGDGDDMYGFSDAAQLTWTFSTGIYEFDFLTWAHGDIGDPATQYELFTVEAFDSDGALVESLIVEDRDQEFGDFETFEMNFDQRVLSIRVTFTAVYPPGDASSALIPYLRSGAGCIDPDLDGYLESLMSRSPVAEEQGLPDTR